MKIISKYKDYYDNVSHQFLDKEIIYVRKSDKFPIKKSSTIPDVRSHYRGTFYNEFSFVSMEIIGFCGKLYPVVTFSHSYFDDDVTDIKKNIYSFYNPEDLENFIQVNEVDIDTKSKYTKLRYYYGVSLAVLIHFLKTRDNYDKLEKLFLKHKVPTFVLRQGKNSNDYLLYTNPILKNYSFYKVKDHFSAHQEIYQFVSGTLPQPDRPMVKISDKDKISKHGFDDYSFRKLPSKKKKGIK